MVAAPAECYEHNSITGQSKPFSCGQPGRGSNGGLLFGTASLRANTDRGGFNSFEIRVPVVYDQAISAPFRVISQWPGFRMREATVDMTVPYQPPPMNMMMCTMCMVTIAPSFQPTPSATARGDDLMLVGSSLAPGTLPVAFSNDDGSFTVTNFSVGNFDARSREPGVKRLAGDFNNDGNLDFALVGGANWSFIPVAMALGNGNFTVTELSVGSFAALAAASDVKPVAGDFDGDFKTDIALVGGSSNTVPIAFSQGDGSFTTSAGSAGAFPTWARAVGARPIVGNFNFDDCDDIALVGGDGWTMLPHVYSNCDGSFTAHNASATGTGFMLGCSYGACGIYYSFVGYEWNFATTVNQPDAQVVAADFNGDGLTDLAVTGTNTTQGLRFAFTNADGTFELVENHDPTWAGWANTDGAKVQVGDFNGDGWNDLALTGVPGWNQLPLSLNEGHNTFASDLWAISTFGTWAGLPGARVVVGDYNGDNYDDLAVTGVSGWTQIPVAMNTGNGFDIRQQGTARFPAWTPDTSATLFVGKAN